MLAEVSNILSIERSLGACWFYDLELDWILKLRIRMSNIYESGIWQTESLARLAPVVL